MEEKEMFESSNSVDYSDNGMTADKAKNIKKTFQRFFKDLMKQKWKLLIVSFCLILSSVFSVLAPMVLGKAIDRIAEGIGNAAASGEKFSLTLQTMGGIMLVLAALYLLSALFNYIPQHILASVAQNLTLSMRISISDKLNRLPLRYFDTHKKGDILSRVTGDLERVSDTLQESMSQLVSSAVTVVGAFVMLMLISPSLTLAALGTVVASILIAAFIALRTNRYYAANQKALGELNANIEEAFTGNDVVKAFNLQEHMIRSNDALNEKMRQTSMKAQFVTYAINPLVRLMGQIGYIIIAVKGALSVISGTISIGDIQAAFQYVNQISEPVSQLAFTMNSLQGALASAERVYEILDEAEEVPDSTEEIRLPAPKGNVVFKHVRFGYSEDKMLMQDINITARAGSKIAVVGPTGAGKTTLVNLLMRFYELHGGSISVDETNINDMSRKELRSILGMVLQDTWLFDGTIAENIAYGKDDASPEEIRIAAKTARVDYFIRTMPQGYDTVLDDDRMEISAGQKQLLTIARAILADPAILILDEATSSVDTRTEGEIQKAMHSLMKGRTSFVIAHRLSTIRDADLILVMREGTIVEQGTHQQLLEQNGFYAELYNSQFAAKASSI